MLYDDYISYTLQYQSLYGKRTIVLMEVGSFFELYSVEDDDRNVIEGADMSEICSLLNIQSTRKNKAILQCSRTNPMMAGFPSYSLKKFMDILVSENYTVILVEQVTPPPNPERKVTQIVSPSTYMEPETRPDHRYVMCMYVFGGYQRASKEYHPYIACAYADLTTGETVVIEPISTSDCNALVSEAARLCTAYTPKEVVVIGDKEIQEILHFSQFTLWLQSLSICVQNRINTDHSMFHTISYQQAVLRKVYKHTGLYSPIEYVQLEKYPSSVVCFTYLIQFVYEHNETLLQTLRVPIMVYPQLNLLVTHTSLEQLNILPKINQESSVLQLLQTCDTAMGKRLFKERLVAPITDPVELEHRYHWIELVQKNQHYLTLRTLLRPIKDMERLFRRIHLKVIQPCELVTLIESIEHAYDVSLAVVELHVEHDTWTIPQHHEIKSLLEKAYATWNMEVMKTVNLHQLEKCIYLPGIHTEMDELVSSLDILHKPFHDLVALIQPYEEIKLECTAERREYQLTMTKKRYESYCDRRPKHHPVCTVQPFSTNNKSVVKITFPGMNDLQQRIHEQTAQLRELMLFHYQKDMEEYKIQYTLLMESLCSMIARLDVAVTCAKHAHEYRYVKPTIDHSGGDSYLHATGVRHPLIERIHTNVQYVTNDVQLGQDESRGMLLYGINFSGKSSYMKSVGVNIILAQMGCYVAADSFHFRPYDHVFTRIPSGDNLFKGQSTFVVEMNEVRTILKQSTNRSLVIGDEVASGTETVSGIAIVASTLLSLVKRRASFLFASHLHEVAELDIIKNEKQIGLYHMSIHYDEERKVLCYDRVLKKGTGSTMYGLEVCQSLHMPEEFLHTANTIRQTYLDMTPHLVPMKVSSYSSKVIVDTCSVCGQKAEEVHHLKEQHTADKYGFIGHIHKNEQHNLAPLCTACHDRIHNENTKVEGYRMTSSGVTLFITLPDEKVVQQQYDELHPKITALRAKGMSIQAISKELGITSYKVNQYIKKK